LRNIGVDVVCNFFVTTEEFNDNLGERLYASVVEIE
jgi:hypothetical protein